MKKPSLNAFKGYSYQEAVYMLFVAIMDVSRNIDMIKAEIISEHNFDDIYIFLKDFSSIYVQTKNYDKVDKLQILDNKVIINSNESVVSDIGINIFIVNNYKIEPNSSILGLPSYEENNIHIIALNIDDIFDILDKLYDGLTSRINQITKVSLDKCTNTNNTIRIEDLPPLYFFSNELLEKTLKIRNFRFDDSKKTIFIVGKPGVGKSHLVNELDFSNKVLNK